MRDSGVYYLQIRGTTYWFLKVYCEQEIADGGWTVSLLSISHNIYGIKIKVLLNFIMLLFIGKWNNSNTKKNNDRGNNDTSIFAY